MNTLLIRTRSQLCLAVMLTLVATISPLDSRAADERTIATDQASRQAQYNLVKAVQKALNAQGYDPGPVDGIRGPKTDAALLRFQEDKGLFADGIIGPMTLEKLGL